jgi:hypothetical protein
MDEAEWTSDNDTRRMLRYLGTLSFPRERKYRLFLCACCRGSWHLLPDDVSRQAVLVAERFADGHAERAEMVALRRVGLAVGENLDRAVYSLPWQADLRDRIAAHGIAVQATVRDPSESLRHSARGLGSLLSADAYATLLRDLFGNPFRPVSLDPTWRTPPVTALAQAAYEERILPAGTLEPTRLAVLADALEEAGCDNADILGHLRSPGLHVRGCWPLDLLLGKE